MRKFFARFGFLFAWYDLWIGFYWDRKNKTLYFCFLPTLVLVVDCHRYFKTDIYE